MYNTTFDDKVPMGPQWSGPPHTIVQVQAILYASLAASLLSALLAMLGKQWLNQYSSTDMRGTAVERGRDRQRKLDGIDSWYFKYVMESLPLMLQAALLLLGCALCRYLWEIDTTVASVVLGVTGFGVFFYISITAAGTISESCPYQTPGSRIIRSTPLALASALSTFTSAFVKCSKTAHMIQKHVRRHRDSPLLYNATPTVKRILRKLPGALAVDARHLGRAVVQPLVLFAQRVYVRFPGAPSTPSRLDQQTAMLDIKCVSWILRTSLDKSVHLSALESLATAVPLNDFDPALVADCFNVFSGCTKVVDGSVVITRESERLATASAICLLHTVSHLLVIDPTSDVLRDVGKRYNFLIIGTIKSDSPALSQTLRTIYLLISSGWRYWGSQDPKPSNHEHVVFAHALAKLSQSEYQRRGELPERILRCVVAFLSQNTLSPTSVVVDCLSIIAIDLGCDISRTRIGISDGRYIYA